MNLALARCVCVCVCKREHVVNGDSVGLNLCWVCSICFGSYSNHAVRSHARISHIPSALYALLCAHYFHLQLSRNSFSKNKVKLRELIAKTQNDYVQPVSLLIFLTVTNHLCVTPAFSKSVWAPSISILILLCSLAKANLFCYPLPITFTLFFFAAAAIAEQQVIITRWNLISALLSHMLWL